MSEQPTGSEALTDEQISAEPGGEPLGDPDEATDPDVRNTTREQDSTESGSGSDAGRPAAGTTEVVDPPDQNDPLQELDSADDGLSEEPLTSPTD